VWWKVNLVRRGRRGVWPSPRLVRRCRSRRRIRRPCRRRAPPWPARYEAASRRAARRPPCSAGGRPRCVDLPAASRPPAPGCRSHGTGNWRCRRRRRAGLVVALSAAERLWRNNKHAVDCVHLSSIVVNIISAQKLITMICIAFYFSWIITSPTL